MLCASTLFPLPLSLQDSYNLYALTGETRLCASRYMLSVDGVIVNDHIATFAVGLAMLFACYYNLNIMYPPTSASTLEFIQR